MNRVAVALALALASSFAACGGRTGAPATPAPPVAAGGDALAALTTSTAPASDACAFSTPGVGAFASQLIASAGAEAGPAEASCEPDGAGRRCSAIIPGPGAPFPDGDGGPATWFEYELDATGALVAASLRCGEQM